MQKLIYWLAPFYTFCIAIGSLTDSKIPKVDINNIDKVYHTVAYFIMMVVWYVFFYHRFFERQLNFKYNLITIFSEWSKTIAIGAAVISTVIGGSIELGQGFISQNRSMDIYDFIANTSGIIIAVFVLWILSFVITKR